MGLKTIRNKKFCDSNIGVSKLIWVFAMLLTKEYKKNKPDGTYLSNNDSLAIVYLIINIGW